jgi:hypothetical protein
MAASKATPKLGTVVPVVSAEKARKDATRARNRKAAGEALVALGLPDVNGIVTLDLGDLAPAQIAVGPKVYGSGSAGIFGMGQVIVGGLPMQAQVTLTAIGTKGLFEAPETVE